MAASVAADPVLKRFRSALNAAYGDRLERVILFGSHARGDARPDSDYDVAVFLRNMGDRFKELRRVAELSNNLVDETGESIHALVYAAGAYDERTPLMREIRREGVDL
ncbi:MAG TPA: nucleotidyltransferase domain-containing protein [Rhodopila sp.]|uniref:nucleotidyltransferase domain-containing protein n=1 Tax=Rhodopila sp. TaxID=2480087 RepID=UPI002C816327|nr:nucleotidyltransferase domain-containing protein [Rhodopila sp.]HVY17739.1 nucleotidyltransferase domain-containing protein [Rhodopila sp.]